MMIFVNNLVQSLFSGFQITVIVLFILKRIYKKEDLLWRNLFMLSNCILLFTSLLYAVSYFSELFMAWYSQVVYEQQAFKWRVLGPYWWSYWGMIVVPFAIPQILWIKKFRRSYKTSLILIPFLSLGFIWELIVIIATSYYKDYLPSSWTYYAPSTFEIILPFLIFTFVLMLLYWIFRKRLYTQQPSS